MYFDKRGCTLAVARMSAASASTSSNCVSHEHMKPQRLMAVNVWRHEPAMLSVEFLQSVGGCIRCLLHGATIRSQRAVPAGATSGLGFVHDLRQCDGERGCRALFCELDAQRNRIPKSGGGVGQIACAHLRKARGIRAPRTHHWPKRPGYDGGAASSTMFPFSSTVAVVTGLFLLSSLRSRFSSFLAFFSMSFLRFSNW